MRLLLLVGAAGSLLTASVAAGHRSGCHAVHSCPSDHHSYVWHSGGRGYDCAAPGAREYEPSRDRTRIRYGGRTYFCRVAGLRSGIWKVQRLSASIPMDPFQLYEDGARVGATKLVAIASRVGTTQRFPQVMVIAASGYLRLKPGADPVPPLPFGQSLVLGPAVFGTSTSFPGQPRLFFDPQIQRVSINHARDGTLHIRISASDRNLTPNRTETNQIANLRWDLILHRPTRQEIRLDVSGTFTFTEQVTPDPTRTAELQSFRLMQISSMYIDPQRHDVDAIRFRGQSGPVEIPLSAGQANSLLPTTPTPLASNHPTLDVVHTDNAGLPNGNTPSYRINLTTVHGPSSGPLTPRAFFNSSQDLNDDNLGVWIDQRPPVVIPRGAHGAIAYTVVASADPLHWP